MHLHCVSAYDGNPWGEVGAIIGEDEHGLHEIPASIRLYGGWYTIKFRPSKLMCMPCICVDWHFV